MMPAAYISWLIGTRGAHVREIEEKTGTKIVISKRQNRDSHVPITVIALAGDGLRALADCERMIREGLNGVMNAARPSTLQPAAAKPTAAAPALAAATPPHPPPPRAAAAVSRPGNTFAPPAGDSIATQRLQSLEKKVELLQAQLEEKSQMLDKVTAKAPTSPSRTVSAASSVTASTASSACASPAATKGAAATASSHSLPARKARGKCDWCGGSDRVVVADPSDPNRATYCGRCWVGWHAESLLLEEAPSKQPAVDSAEAAATTCSVCGHVAKTRSALFKHIGETGHKGRPTVPSRQAAAPVEHTLLLSSLGTRLYNRIPFAREAIKEDGGLIGCLRHATDRRGHKSFRVEPCQDGKESATLIVDTALHATNAAAANKGKAGAGAAPKAPPKAPPKVTPGPGVRTGSGSSGGGGAEAAAVAFLRHAPRGRMTLETLTSALYKGGHRDEIVALGGPRAFFAACADSFECSDAQGVQGAVYVHLCVSDGAAAADAPPSTRGPGAPQPRRHEGSTVAALLARAYAAAGGDGDGGASATDNAGHTSPPAPRSASPLFEASACAATAPAGGSGPAFPSDDETCVICFEEARSTPSCPAVTYACAARACTRCSMRPTWAVRPHARSAAPTSHARSALPSNDGATAPPAAQRAGKGGAPGNERIRHVHAFLGGTVLRSYNIGGAVGLAETRTRMHSLTL